MKQLFIGIDGGGTKTIARIEDDAGNVLGEAVDGPANIRISVAQAWQSIHAAINKILNPLNIDVTDNNYLLHVGMGLAGCEIPSAYQQFVTTPHSFKTLIVKSDAYTACLGAHDGNDGAIIIVGTGVAGFQIENGHTSRVSGWGFPHDDKGGGAWLGLKAIVATLRWSDGRSPESGLSDAIFQHFNRDLPTLVSWANHATSSQFAELAPIVIALAMKGDATARSLLQRSANHIGELDEALYAAQVNKQKRLPRVVFGGIAPHINDYLSAEFRTNITEGSAQADVGALLMVKKEVQQGQGVIV